MPLHEKTRPPGGTGQVDAGQATNHHQRSATHVEQTEAALLGSMILSRDAREGALRMVTADDFSREAHRIFFETVATLHADEEYLDQVCVNDRLILNGKIDDVGGLASVWALTSVEGCPVTASWPAYSTVVAREGKRRRILRQLHDAIGRLERGEDPAVVHLGPEVAA